MRWAPAILVVALSAGCVDTREPEPWLNHGASLPPGGFLIEFFELAQPSEVVFGFAVENGTADLCILEEAEARAWNATGPTVTDACRRGRSHDTLRAVFPTGGHAIALRVASCTDLCPVRWGFQADGSHHETLISGNRRRA